MLRFVAVFSGLLIINRLFAAAVFCLRFATAVDLGRLLRAAFGLRLIFSVWLRIIIGGRLVVIRLLIVFGISAVFVSKGSRLIQILGRATVCPFAAVCRFSRLYRLGMRILRHRHSLAGRNRSSSAAEFGVRRVTIDKVADTFKSPAALRHSHIANQSRCRVYSVILYKTDSLGAHVVHGVVGSAQRAVAEKVIQIVVDAGRQNFEGKKQAEQNYQNIRRADAEVLAEFFHAVVTVSKLFSPTFTII